MWIITCFGFFSVVRKPGDEDGCWITIRGRVRSDLESLRDGYLPGSESVVETSGSDYRYRFRVKAADFGDALRRMATDIDYDNFKDAVAERQSIARHDIYTNVWSVMRHLYCCDHREEAGVEGCDHLEGGC